MCIYTYLKWVYIKIISLLLLLGHMRKNSNETRIRIQVCWCSVSFSERICLLCVFFIVSSIFIHCWGEGSSLCYSSMVSLWTCCRVTERYRSVYPCQTVILRKGSVTEPWSVDCSSNCSCLQRDESRICGLVEEILTATGSPLSSNLLIGSRVT